MESIITDMAEKYRDDFGYGYDEDMQGYIDDHEDETKKLQINICMAISMLTRAIFPTLPEE